MNILAIIENISRNLGLLLAPHSSDADRSAADAWLQNFQDGRSAWSALACILARCSEKLRLSQRLDESDWSGEWMLLTFAMGAVCRKLLAALVAGEGASSILPKFDDANSIDITWKWAISSALATGSEYYPQNVRVQACVCLSRLLLLQQSSLQQQVRRPLVVLRSNCADERCWLCFLTVLAEELVRMQTLAITSLEDFVEHDWHILKECIESSLPSKEAWICAQNWCRIFPSKIGVSAAVKSTCMSWQLQNTLLERPCVSEEFQSLVAYLEEALSYPADAVQDVHWIINLLFSTSAVDDKAASLAPLLVCLSSLHTMHWRSDSYPKIFEAVHSMALKITLSDASEDVAVVSGFWDDLCTDEHVSVSSCATAIEAIVPHFFQVAVNCHGDEAEDFRRRVGETILLLSNVSEFEIGIVQLICRGSESWNFVEAEVAAWMLSQAYDGGKSHDKDTWSHVIRIFGIALSKRQSWPAELLKSVSHMLFMLVEDHIEDIHPFLPHFWEGLFIAGLSSSECALACARLGLELVRIDAFSGDILDARAWTMLTDPRIAMLRPGEPPGETSRLLYMIFAELATGCHHIQKSRDALSAGISLCLAQLSHCQPQHQMEFIRYLRILVASLGSDSGSVHIVEKLWSLLGSKNGIEGIASIFVTALEAVDNSDQMGEIQWHEIASSCFRKLSDEKDSQWLSVLAQYILRDDARVVDALRSMLEFYDAEMKRAQNGEAVSSSLPSEWLAVCLSVNQLQQSNLPSSLVHEFESTGLNMAMALSRSTHYDLDNLRLLRNYFASMALQQRSIPSPEICRAIREDLKKFMHHLRSVKGLHALKLQRASKRCLCALSTICPKFID